MGRGPPAPPLPLHASPPIFRPTPVGIFPPRRTRPPHVFSCGKLDNSRGLIIAVIKNNGDPGISPCNFTWRLLLLFLFRLSSTATEILIELGFVLNISVILNIGTDCDNNSVVNGKFGEHVLNLPSVYILKFKHHFIYLVINTYIFAMLIY